MQSTLTGFYWCCILKMTYIWNEPHLFHIYSNKSITMLILSFVVPVPTDIGSSTFSSRQKNFFFFQQRRTADILTLCWFHLSLYQKGRVSYHILVYLCFIQQSNFLRVWIVWQFEVSRNIPSGMSNRTVSWFLAAEILWMWVRWRSPDGKLVSWFWERFTCRKLKHRKREAERRILQMRQVAVLWSTKKEKQKEKCSLYTILRYLGVLHMSRC